MTGVIFEKSLLYLINKAASTSGGLVERRLETFFRKTCVL